MGPQKRLERRVSKKEFQNKDSKEDSEEKTLILEFRSRDSKEKISG